MEKFDLKKETIALQAKRIMYYFESRDYVDWAIKAIQNGYESENLFIVAGLDNEYTETLDLYFNRAKQDLHLNEDLDDLLILDIYAEYVMNEIIDGSIDAEKGLSVLVKLDDYFELDLKYSRFSELAYDIDCLRFDDYTVYSEHLSLDYLDEYIRNECELFLAY